METFSTEELSKYYWGKTDYLHLHFNAIDIKDENELGTLPPKYEGGEDGKTTVIEGYYFKNDGTFISHELTVGYKIVKGNWRLIDNHVIEKNVDGEIVKMRITAFEPGKQLTIFYD